jgi:hypothetical protein
MNSLEEKKLFVEVKKIVNGQVVSSKPGPASVAQKAEYLERRAKLIRLKKHRARIDEEIHVTEQLCKHEVSYDTRGWPYDWRFCAGCDKDQGSV